jgi:hypothetical protein
LDIFEAIVNMFVLAPGAGRSKQDEPPIPYESASSPNVEAWRWRVPDPELNLAFCDEGDRSIIYLPNDFSFIELLIVAIGYGMLGLGVFLALHFLILSFNLVGAILWSGLIGGSGWYLLFAGSRVIRLELEEKRLTLVSQFGFRLERKHCYPHHPHLEFRGKRQSFWTMDKTQTAPNYNFTIQNSKRGKAKTFVTACHQPQGSWLVGGLEAWRDR